MGHDPSPNHGIMAQPAQPDKLDHVIRGQQHGAMFRNIDVDSDKVPDSDEERNRKWMRATGREPKRNCSKKNEGVVE